MKKIIIILLILILVSCQNEKSETVNETTNDSYTEVNLENNVDLNFDSNYGVESLKPIDPWQDKILMMSLEEKVAQLFIVDFRTFTASQPQLYFDDQITQFLSLYPIGGVIYFKENVQSSEQVKILNEALQDYMTLAGKEKLFISVDEEGGLVSRLGQTLDEVIYLPKAATLATNYTLEEVHELGAQLGQDLNVHGFNMNFAPVLDVNTNPSNPIIGTRAFSNDPEIASLYSSVFAKGLISSHIAAVGKHFPGHGDTQTDSHLGEVTAWMDSTRFESIEKLPFEEAVSNRISGIMIGHILTPNLTTDNKPASLSSEIITELLREDMNYNGLVITDSLQMKAITDQYSSEEVGILALEAGCDLLLMPDDFISTYEGILDAVRTGRLEESRINASLRRILRAKNNL